MMHGEWMPWGYGGGMWFGPLFFIILIALVVALLVWLFRRPEPGGPDTGPANPNRAREILDERFARGEIDQEEYEQRRRALGG